MVFKWLVPIQIHLLFLFIATTPTGKPKSLHSNTSLVLIYQSWMFTSHFFINIQIHLMFLFILLFRWKIHILHTIQIHLMFLFIEQTVNFYLYRIVIQIHLLFLFIVVLGVRIGWNRLEFKYISCSYLSQAIKGRISAECYSNTSHVLIYLIWIVSS